MRFLNIYLLIIVFVAAAAFALSFRYENVLVGKKVLRELDDEAKKKKFLWAQRVNIVLLALIAAAVYIFPLFRKGLYISLAVLAVLLRGIYLNRKYLGKWRIK